MKKLLFLIILFCPALAHGAAPTNGLVGYWTFNEGSGSALFDYSGNRNNGTTSGATAATFVDGKRGKALSFDGSNDYVKISHTQGLLGNIPTFTISTWFKTSGVSQRIYMEANSTNNVPLLGIWINGSGQAEINIRDDANVTGHTVSTLAYNDNKWHHMVGVQVSKSSRIIYVDGVQVGTNTTALGTFTLNNSSIGVIKRAPGAADSGFFNGSIDDVRVYNRALSAAEIKQLYESRSQEFVTESSNGLVGYWSFDEGSGSALFDYSGNRNNGTTTGATAATFIDGKRGKALSFDGTNDYVGISSSKGIIGTAKTGTMAAWIKLVPSGSNKDVYAESSNSSAFPLLILRADTNNKAAAFIRDTAGASNTIVSNTTVADGTWHHIAVTQNSSGVFQGVYVDGRLDTASNTGNSLGAMGVNKTNIGATLYQAFPQGVNFVNGQIDEVRVYNRILSEAEIRKLYQSGNVISKPPTNLGLAGYWKFDEGSGSAIFDSSGRNNHGTTSGAFAATFIDGKRGKALSFDGTNDYVSVPRNSILNSTIDGSHTVSMWIRNSQVTTVDRLFGMPDATSGTHAVLLNYTSVGKVSYYEGSGADVNSLLSTTADLNNGKWRHLVFQLDGTTMRIYVDGVLDSSRTMVAATLSDENLYIGRTRGIDASDQYFNGLIDDVRIYNRALSAQEIRTLYQSGAVKLK